MIDQHMHSIYSPDSRVGLDEYLQVMKEYNNDYINITDHLDILYNLDKYDSHNYYKSIEKLIADVTTRNDSRIKVGIEVGYNNNTKDEVNKFLNKHDFSLIILSIHDNDEAMFKYSNTKHLNYSTEKIITIYCKQMYDAVSSDVDFDILAHIGYIFRYFRDAVNPLEYVDHFDEVLKKLSETNKVLELNTGCLDYGAANIEEFYLQILKKFYSYGGKYISLGSDAHSASSYCRNFDQAIRLMKEAGFKHTTLVKNRKYNLIEI